jgi:hypothetical protein
MLKPSLWTVTEPRLIFPVFGTADNLVDLALQPGPRRTWRDLARPAYNHFRRGKPWQPVLSDYWNLLLDPPYRFRGAFVDREGRLLAEGHLPGRFRAGQYFTCRVNDWLSAQGVPMQDGAFILISSRGRTDLWNSSPGNATLRIANNDHVAGYRTGFFTRSLNEGKKHYGFTGLNPQIDIGRGLEPGLLLINHSSDPLYERTVQPTVRLHRNASDFIEADFGAIPPFGVRERAVRDLFPTAKEYLAPSAGRGFTIANCKGSTLASIHVFRDENGEIACMEHSRPAHTNILDYL